MGNVTTYNTASYWAVTQPAQRLVSVFVGQKYAADAVPYGATGIVAAPDAHGGCDGLLVQVVPSPLPCDKLRESLSANGRQIADLAGVPLMESGNVETMLVPTGANACVLVALRNAYSK